MAKVQNLKILNGICVDVENTTTADTEDVKTERESVLIRLQMQLLYKSHRVHKKKEEVLHILCKVRSVKGKLFTWYFTKDT